jgi:arylformamidase
VDAPYHCYSNGKGIDEVPLFALVGEAYVADFTRVSRFISKKDLQEIKGIGAIEILLCKTKNSEFRLIQKEFDRSYIYVSAEAAKYLKKTNIRTLGVDYLSVEGYNSIEPSTHKILLDSGIVIVEGLNLRNVKPGFYRFCCLPLKFKGLDGAPARAILIDETID